MAPNSLPMSNLGAIGCVITATLFLAIMDTIAKYLLATYDASQIVWVRYVGQIFWVAIILLIRKYVTKTQVIPLLKSNNIKLQIIRSLCLFGGTFCLFTGLKHVPLALGAAIAELAPVFVTILAAIILKEAVGIYRWGMVLLGLSGGLLIMKPFSHSFDPWLLFPLGTSLFFSGYYIATRYLGNKDSTWTTLFYTALVGSILATVVLIFDNSWQVPLYKDIFMLVILPLMGALGHLLLIVAFTRAPASVIAPFTYMGLIWAGMFGILVFAERPDIWSYTGAALIVLSGIIIFYRERNAKIKNRTIIQKGIR